MKKVLAVVLALSMVLTLTGTVFAGQDETGNGAPSGQHYTLNIIGVKVDKGKNANMGNDLESANGNVIFVNMEGHTKIGLIESTEAGLDADDFAVLDKNGTDQDGALFALPDPGLDPYVIGNVGGADVMSDYSVFARPLGTPGGSATITTCADIVEGEWATLIAGLLPGKVFKSIENSAGTFGGFASLEQVGTTVTFRDNGKSTFTNVTAELLTIVFEIVVEVSPGVYETYYLRVPIFDPALQGEYWDYNNDNLKVLQLRFYPGVETDVSAGDGAFLP
ncbi:MAG: hypothetical protein JSV74_01725 [Dehalococcoidia bacterium]|nr:MAG: hypothetical protein JSV74_01725 [Dehalococcoidia bacterium]